MRNQAILLKRLRYFKMAQLAFIINEHDAEEGNVSYLQN